MTSSLALVLVNYASVDLIAANLPVRVVEEAGARVVVVDNFSADHERSAVSQLCRDRGWTLVTSPNDGFGSGVNRGVRAAESLGVQRVVLVNPDLRVDSATLRALEQHLIDNPRTLVCPRLVGPKGEPHFDGFVLDLSNGRTRRGWPGDEVNVGWLTAACIGFRIVDFEELGGFAEDYFMYWEDVDLSWRARSMGMKLDVRHDLVAVHDEGGTQERRGAAKSGLYYRFNARNRLLFAARHLDARTVAAWRRSSLGETRQIWLRGGRRQLFHHPTGPLAAARGMIEGLRMSTRTHDGQGAPVLIAHPSADLYGSDKVVLETVNAFRQSGRRVIVVVPSPGPLVAELRRLGAQVEMTPMPVIRKAVLRPAGMAGLFADTVRGVVPAVRLIRRSRPAALIVNTVTIPHWLVLARITGVAAVCHVHEAEPSSSNLLWRVLYAPLFLASRVVCNSQFTLQAMTARWASLGRRAVVVHNPVRGPATALSPLRSHPVPIRLMFIGRLNPRKGPQVLIRAVGLLRDCGVDVQACIVGSVFEGYEWFETQLRDLVSQLGLEERVVFLGQRSDIWEIMEVHDIVVTPSVGEESFGNTVVEAALGGRPVVCTRRMAEAADGLEAARLTTPGSAEELADAVMELMDDWSQVQVQVDRDALTAQHRYSPRRYHRELVAAVLGGVPR